MSSISHWMTCKKKWRLPGWTYGVSDPIEIDSVDFEFGIVRIASRGNTVRTVKIIELLEHAEVRR